MSAAAALLRARSMRVATALLLLSIGVSCSDSSLRVRVLFPDAATRAQSSKLWILAIDPLGGQSCRAVLGRPASELGVSVLSSVEIDLRAGTGEPSLANVPMRGLLLSALVHDLDGRPFLQACSRLDAHPGDTLEVTLRLNCAPGRTPCLDLDGDGVPADRDCDDEDPCRSPSLTEASNTCSTQAQSFPPLPAPCLQHLGPGAGGPPYCDDGIDQDCSGEDAHCEPDGDCDSFSPPLDCDDAEPAINPKAAEACDGKDNNCNGIADEGCSPCDIDGDGHALTGSAAPGCALPKDDLDDYDAGIHPATTAKSGNAEGGHLLGALRGWCRSATGLEKDGKAPRDVDHDNDKLPASLDGCPQAACDQDGDGFPGAASACKPPASLADCDDTDPLRFPGAPDKCGDGKAQNCVADAACACDKDGDGYCSPADCNDADPQVHPWATELCNGRDDDCDELTDEANPGPNGQPMPVASKSCNDDNDGTCGACPYGPAADCKNGHLLSGLCVCSGVKPAGIRDPGGNRVACAGESLTATASPRCFGARQPTKETCNNADEDCDGTYADETQEACPGQTCCSSPLGCKDLGSDFQNCGACGKACSATTASTCKAQECRCGTAAACSNGEVCQSGMCRCNGCYSGGTCVSGYATSACGSGGGSCVSCGTGYACSGGKCACGGCVSGSICYGGSSDLHCGDGGGTCVNCTNTGRYCSSSHSCACDGCWSAGSCYTDDPARCGASCTACTAPPCRSPTCSGGSCGTSNLPDLSNCTGGKCLGGSCCTGCNSGGTCQPGTAANACGMGGGNCVDCTAGGLGCSAGTCV